MSDMRKLLEAMDSMSKAEKKPTGPKFPGYWKGTDSADKAKSKMVGSAEESIIKDLHKTAKEKVTEWQLEEELKQFKESVFLYNPNLDSQQAALPTTAGLDKGEEVVSKTATTPAKPAVAPVAPSSGKTTWNDIYQLNKDQIKDPNLIYKGQELKLPGTDEKFVVQKGDNLSKIAKFANTNTGKIDPASVVPGDPTVKMPTPATPPAPLPTGVVPATGDKPSGTPGQRPTMANDPRLTATATPATQKDNAATVAPTPAMQKTSAATSAPVAPASSAKTSSLAATAAPAAAAAEVPPEQIRNPKTLQDYGKKFYNWLKEPKMDAPKNVKGPTGQPILANDFPSNIKFKEVKDVQRWEQLHPDLRTSLVRVARDSGLPIRINSSVRTPAEQEELYQRGQRGEPGVYSPGKELQSHGGHAIDMSPGQLQNLHNWLQKNDPKGEKYGLKTGLEFKTPDPVHLQLRSYTPPVKESLEEQFARLMAEQSGNKEQEADYGDDYQDMVRRVGQRAKQGPMKTVWDEKTRRYRVVPVKQKAVKEFQNQQSPDSQITSPPSPAATASSQFTARDDILRDQGVTEAGEAGAQDPNAQVTSPASPVAAATQQQQAAQKKAQDEREDLQTALGTVSSLKPMLGPKTDVNQAAAAITKVTDNKPLTAPESQAISSITPLVMKAAETPAAASALKTALTTAGVLRNQGK